MADPKTTALTGQRTTLPDFHFPSKSSRNSTGERLADGDLRLFFFCRLVVQELNKQTNEKKPNQTKQTKIDVNTGSNQRRPARLRWRTTNQNSSKWIANAIYPPPHLQTSTNEIWPHTHCGGGKCIHTLKSADWELLSFGTDTPPSPPPKKKEIIDKNRKNGLEHKVKSWWIAVCVCLFGCDRLEGSAILFRHFVSPFCFCSTTRRTRNTVETDVLFCFRSLGRVSHLTSETNGSRPTAGDPSDFHLFFFLLIGCGSFLTRTQTNEIDQTVRARRATANEHTQTKYHNYS